MNRGSEFRKWDLHLHSPYSIMNNQFKRDQHGKIDINSYISKIKEENIEAIGLTNYFNFTADDFILKEKLEDEGIIVFLNLEVRLSNINKADDLFDYHIIFDDTLENEVIKNVLANLKANLGAEQKSFNRLNTFEINKKANIDFKNLLDVLSNDRELNGRYLKGFLSRGHGSATSDSDPKNASVYENICSNSDFIIHSSCDDPVNCKDSKCKHNNLETDRSFWLSHKKYVRPLLQSSDAHSIDEIGKKYSWIKSDLTFEGLKQIIFEPEYRISLNKDRPGPDKDELIIDKIIYEGKEIFLSENLNAVIGGRSTGKSTLLNSIAKKLNNSVKIKGNTFENLECFKIFWKDGIEDYSRSVEYIPQEYMIELAQNDELLKSLVNGIIKSKKLDESIKCYEDKTDTLKKELHGLMVLYKENLKNQESLEKPEAEEDATEKRIKNYKNKRDKILSSISINSNEIEQYNIQLETLKELTEKIELYQNDLMCIKNAPQLEINSIKNISTDLKCSPSLNEDFQLIIDEINIQLSEEYIKKLNTLLSKYDDFIGETKSQIIEITEAETFKRCKKQSDSNNEIAILDALIVNENDSLKKIRDYKKYESDLLTENKKLRNEIILKYKQHSIYREELYSAFKVPADDLSITLEFYLKDLENEFDYINARGQFKNDFIQNIHEDINKEVENIFEDNNLKFNGNKNLIDHIEHFLTTDLYSYRFLITYQKDRFDEMSPGKKSFVILKLILDFSDSKIPVLIDQPEDSLDNRAIYKELKEYIKKNKLHRQIITVTHNPNIVVAGDCENVIIANQESDEQKNENEKKFDYINGSLESRTKDINSEFLLKKYSIKEHVCDILEGGEEAFIDRERKYSIYSK